MRAEAETAPLTREELGAWLHLQEAPGIGIRVARQLLAAFGLPGAVLAQRDAALGQFLSSEQIQSLRTPPEGLDALLDDTQRWLDTPGNTLLTLADNDYPAALLELDDPPLMLHVTGIGRAMPQAGQSVAMVGSRNPTPQGLINARQFAKSFSARGLCVVSGLALGIDGAAHEGALDGTGTTLAVVGTGLDRVYPKAHRELAHRIAGRGWIVSEFTLGTPSIAANFPRRNRLIAALSCGTVVVEAAVQSGSLITARLAAELGRDVFAIPGSIHSPQSRGCHALIKQGVKLVEDAQDVLEELKLETNPARASLAAAPDPDATTDAGLLKVLGHDPVSLDALLARTGLDTATLQARLLELELEGRVARLPGGLFQRVASA
ncbi:MAG: DNA-protecting protein DprA [Ramlibacter sp.]|nr:DNA-protecting protein DprA [Ramlibacter sp.]